MHFLSEVASGDRIPPGKLAYFQERTRNNLYDYVVTRFLQQEKERGLTRAKLARRIGKSPEIITRLLGAPGNWTIDTISDLLLGICAEEWTPSSSSVLHRAQRNFSSNDWMDESAPSLPNGQQPYGTDTAPVLELELT
jgi:hypothetical protein